MCRVLSVQDPKKGWIQAGLIIYIILKNGMESKCRTRPVGEQRKQEIAGKYSERFCFILSEGQYDSVNSLQVGGKGSRTLS